MPQLLSVTGLVNLGLAGTSTLLCWCESQSHWSAPLALKFDPSIHPSTHPSIQQSTPVRRAKGPTPSQPGPSAQVPTRTRARGLKARSMAAGSFRAVWNLTELGICLVERPARYLSISQIERLDWEENTGFGTASESNWTLPAFSSLQTFIPIKPRLVCRLREINTGLPTASKSRATMFALDD